MVVPFFIAHQGCPHRCVFCDQLRIAGGGGLPDGGEILAKIAEYRAGAPGRSVEVAFFGGSFTALPRPEQQRLLQPLQPLLASGAVASIRLSTRPDAVDPSTACFLRAMGVSVVELGVQSMDDEVLALSGRGHSSRDVERAFGFLQDAGLTVGAQLMPGLPGDDEARSLASLKRVLGLNPASLRIYPTLVLADTALASLYRSGGYRPLSLEEAVGLCKQMLLAARRRQVRVLRLGLQPTAELEAPGAILAGPYHPAFGQLVESELYFDTLCRMAAGLPEGSRVDLCCHPGRISDLVGQKRRNLERLKGRFGVEVGALREERGLPPTAITLYWQGGESTADIMEL